MLTVIQQGPDSTAVITGMGVVGLAAMMSLKVSGTPPQKIIVADIVLQRLKRAKIWGATDPINSRECPDLQEALFGITNYVGVNGAIDTIDRQEIIAEALLSSPGKKDKVVTVGVGDVCNQPSIPVFVVC